MPIYIIACRDDGQYVLTTKRYVTKELAERHAATISPSRAPIVIEGADDVSLLHILRRDVLHPCYRNMPCGHRCRRPLRHEGDCGCDDCKPDGKDDHEQSE